MDQTKNQKIFAFDAAGKSLGRLASEVTRALLGKNSARYSRAMPPQDISVEISHIEHARFTGRKLKQHTYYRHSGYIGHLKEERMGELFARNPGMLFKRIVRGMLPKNNHRDRLLKKIIFIA